MNSVRIPFLEICYDRVRLPEVMARIRHACEHREPLHITTLNINFIRLAHRNPHFAEAIRRTDLAAVDGRVFQWATWFLGRPAPEQITGHDIFWECVKLANEKHYGLFLLGADEGIAHQVAEKLERDFPGLRATGIHHGPFSAAGDAYDQKDLARQIRDFRPEFLFMALGAEKQDMWLANHLRELEIPMGLGIGCAFDIVVGNMPRAPKWMQWAGLESVFQLMIRPRRYAKRYLIEYVPSLVRITAFILSRRAAALVKKPPRPPERTH